MNYVPLGRTGLKVSRIILGCGNFGGIGSAPAFFGKGENEAQAHAIMDAAWEMGITVFDTADAYGGGTSETYIGNWLRGKGQRVRDQIILSSKVFNPVGDGPNDRGLSRRHIFRQIDASLRRLGVDHLDMYLIHEPDPSTPLEETLSTLNDLVHVGKVRYIGCSNYSAHALSDALWTSRLNHVVRYDSVQPRYNLLFRMIEDEILPVCRTHGVGVIVYNPLAGGMLTGRYKGQRQVQAGTRFGLGEGRGEMYQKRYWHDEIFDEVDRLSQFFASRGKSLTHAAIAWVLQQPDITSAIIGASTAAQLRDSLKGVGMTLDADELAACDAAWFNLPRERDPQIARR